MDLGIAGRGALVAASSTGIGRAVAHALAREGAKIALVARRRDVLEESARAIAKETGAETFAIPGDLSSADDVGAIAGEAARRLGTVDILVNNAGGPRPGGFETVEPADWEAAFALNLRSAVLLTRAVLPGMKERRWGRIVNLASVSVKQPIEGLILSNSIRAAVAGFSKTLATECAPFNVLVNTVCPGYTRTERLQELAEVRAQSLGVRPEEVTRTMEQAVPMKRIGEPEEIAWLAAFLCSERCSYVTGTVIAVDGGLTRGLL